jgi:branched-chain amino acid transport system permease protein
VETDSNLPYYYVILGAMVVIYLICKGVTRSHMGLAFRAIGQNMEAARTSGINPTYFRIVNFTLSSALVGWIGGLYAHYYGILTPDIMLTSKTVEVLAVAYIGGRGSLWGGAAVAFPFTFLLEMMRSSLSQLPGLNLVIYGVILIVVMVYYSGGLAALYLTLAARARSSFWRFWMGLSRA